MHRYHILSGKIGFFENFAFLSSSRLEWLIRSEGDYSCNKKSYIDTLFNRQSHAHHVSAPRVVNRRVDGEKLSNRNMHLLQDEDDMIDAYLE